VNTYKTKDHERLDKAAMTRLLGALNASPSALRLDDCGAWHIRGNWGHIYSFGPIAAENGFLLVSMSGSARQWTADKRRFEFCRVTQDGDDEGCLHLAGLPTPSQANAIRRSLGIRKALSLSAIERLRARAKEGFHAPRLASLENSYVAVTA
jgi:hypothetical protein